MLEDHTENMAQDAQTPALPRGLGASRDAQFALGSAAICLLVAAVYYQVLGKLVTDWWQIPDFSHGFLVPLFSAYLVWEKREISSRHQDRSLPGVESP